MKREKRRSRFTNKTSLHLCNKLIHFSSLGKGRVVFEKVFSKKRKIECQNGVSNVFSITSLSQNILGQGWDKLGTPRQGQ
jgi:hypothetical protein